MGSSMAINASLLQMAFLGGCFPCISTNDVLHIATTQYVKNRGCLDPP